MPRFKSIRVILPILLSVLLFSQDAIFFIADAEARSGSRSFGSRPSYSSSSSWGKTTQDAFNRKGGGILNNPSGYSKPTLPESTPSGPSGYSKPSIGEKPHSMPSQEGYAKPKLPGGPVTPFESKPGQIEPRKELPGSAGYTKPGLGEQTPQKGAGYEKPVGPPGTSGYTKPSTPSSQKFTASPGFDQKALNEQRRKRSSESLEKYKSEQQKFKNPEVKTDQNFQNNPLYQQSKVYTNYDHGTQQNYRDSFFRGSNWSPPAHAFGGSPSYGLFSGLFLYWMLDHMTDRKTAAFAYNHQNDPGFQKWREEVEKQSKDNAELRSKLAEMDSQVKALQGTPKDPAYVPPGVPPEVVVAPGVLAAKKPENAPLRFATGTTSGWYDRFGRMIKQAVKGVDVQIKPTSGSIENLKLLADGKADMAIVQSDVLAFMQPAQKIISEQSSLYPEYAQLIANRESGIKSISDISPKKNVVYIGPKGSGTALTWEGLAEQSEWYKKIPVKYGDYYEALSEVMRNPKALALFVGGLNSEFLKKAEAEAKRTGNLRLIALNDRHFADKLDTHGNHIYKVVDIPRNVYPDLQKGWFFSGSVETLGVQAVLVLRTEWAEKYGPEAMEALSAAILQAKPEIQKLVNTKQ
jgi:TRAP transporter TAXI family solute receptor